ncbi:MAG: prepilin-type N-terminal cleavage/methylation domain-containing protein [Candidatus Omnitrophica bacterium]|nr:prepilin-type N-terminal cleavage/methylation domain-containing protein [Candidatus Omnitrophota bacterium]MCA9440964.1 prepilin-type N-terminal cleavage/methylation domain-containing protein [Candidatus Omnitrophota bacterium]MCB9782168.1 prepilin-type N-terminal cleavage/methylation domain-containing protein [Candidatus Omnitrophota bacterium]MCB9784980.1 prepilin-type N-terminal cleavage/methylation domain-containing protein [Candidatus Omnitrophota bacterium]
MKSQGGFTLIELLIVIAIVLIMIAGSFRVMRLQTRSAISIHDTELVSSALSSELAEIRRNPSSVEGDSHRLPVPLSEISNILADATGTVRVSPSETKGVFEAIVTIAWNSSIGPREMSMATLIRTEKGREE